MLPILLSFVLMQAPPEAAPSQLAQRAQAWLLAVYPSLRRGDVAMDVYGDEVTTRLVVRARPARRVLGDIAPGSVLLTADVHRSRTNGRVEAVQVRGPVVKSDQLSALTAAVAAHPEWTANDIAAAITSTGGRFPPGTRAAMLAQLPSLADVFGGTATFQQAAFANTPVAGPVWLVDVAVGSREFRIAVEPFEGQVIGLAAR